ncbi:8-oxoguanine deaminase [Petrotoga halophila]|uniref:Hydroxydechloroatrazine ethylaminohydrolase n=1 Tax=Petrotoga halophila DSM 16923 TaxID=1122953 RepID=A0A2S5EDP2_9BACT|nr:8-oxoguanine deaminase [Petrotoga halophila]POZ91231.1 hydroxydechloroatrazine ethylaminohydrolase [Petrotoga halophila DSM 16923]
MSNILIKNVKSIVTMNENREILKGYSILIKGNKIEKIGKDIDISDEKLDEIIDGSNSYVYPGLINTHHHFYQTLTRNIPQVQNVELFDWLKFLYPIWAKVSPQAVYYSTLVAAGELLKTGCTTSVDHFYVFPKDQPPDLLDNEFKAAKDIGIRLHASRGSMSLSEKGGGLPPDSVVQTEREILEDSQRVIEKFHDPSVYSMNRVILAPCSPFSVTKELLEESIKLARHYNVSSHTHLAETKDEERFCLDKFGLRPLEYMESLGWTGPDVWYAHGVHFTEKEIDKLASTKTGVAHCPVSNQKLASGAAKIPYMLNKGVRLGLAVDGSASNDSSNMILEMKIGFLMNRLIHGIKSITAEDILYMATVGGSQLINQPELGSLEEGKAADLFLVNCNRLGYTGGLYDPISLLINTGDTQIVDITIVNGEIVVKQGQLVNVDERKIIEEANRISKAMVE